MLVALCLSLTLQEAERIVPFSVCCKGKPQGWGGFHHPQLCYYFHFTSSSYVFLLLTAWNQLSRNQLSLFSFLVGPSTCLCFSSLSQRKCRQQMSVPQWVLLHLILFGFCVPRCQLIWQFVHPSQEVRPHGTREGLPEKVTLSKGQREGACSAGQGGR